MRAVEAVSSPDHPVATGRRGAVATSVLWMDVNTSGPWGAEDTAFSGASGANVRCREAPGPKLLAPDADGLQALGLKVCLPMGQAGGCGDPDVGAGVVGGGGAPTSCLVDPEVTDILSVAGAGARTVTGNLRTSLDFGPTSRRHGLEACHGDTATISGDPGTKLSSADPATQDTGWDLEALSAAGSATVNGAGPGVALPEAPAVPKGAGWPKWRFKAKGKPRRASWILDASAFPFWAPALSTEGKTPARAVTKEFNDVSIFLLLPCKADGPEAKEDRPRSLWAEGRGRAEAETTRTAANQKPVLPAALCGGMGPEPCRHLLSLPPPSLGA